ncbi:hypothetical protein N7492_003008 [Penicillium capsulatum]|uniref:GTPase-activating protein GYP5 n=1 Tax=Penicillium capsulatum TaxID=69766 RepID=A0A9W9LVS5_9EURO|nr:hypothetical protein N7492_003008 [Penicillium capsulatum]KAJ6122401.1 hypothetical protein N7512_004866 [Penicillium capsulatum]
MSSNRSSRDYEGESFDDAPETNETLNAAIPQSSSTRSLTDSPPVGSNVSPETTEKPTLPSESQDEQKEGAPEGAEQPKKNKKKDKNKAKKDEENAIDEKKDDEAKEDDKEKEHGVAEKPSEEVKPDESEEVKEVEEAKDDQPDKQAEKQAEPTATDTPESEETQETHDPTQKSPLLTSHRLSNASSLDEVNLSNSKEDEPPAVQDVAPDIKSEMPPVPPKDEAASSQSSGLMGLTGSLPSLPWGPPPANKNPPPAAPPQPTRKPSGPFAWFSRSSTGAKEAKSPSAFTRRDTSNSVSTIASNLDLVARSHDGEDGDTASVNSKRPRRNSLKDQFKLLRMRGEEVPGAENDQASTRSRASISQAGASPPIIREEAEDGILAAPAAPASGTTSPGAVPPSTINPALAPGTVSGFSRSASDASVPVDWDLWEQLVNNGPQALASSEELNAAIQRGIPQTIRGVIWQILADCRTTDLEDIYRELVTRGTDKDRQSPHVQVNGAAEKESSSSSRSSIRSNNSGSATQSTSVAPSPSQETSPEKLAKDQAAAESARLKKAKDEATALQKLEKTIRRDLGARTSYSKYFISQGSQESLYGLCKAYALYDEAVGYAQGMNFIVMPLLFNMDEVEAFELLVKLMNKYGLREMFIQDMPGLHRSLYQFERLLEDLQPALYCHLRRRGVPPQLYATQWFLTLFAYRFPLQLVLRIYDLIFEEGLESTILKFAVAIMSRNSEALLSMKDMSSLTTFLKERIFDVYIDKQPSASSILESGFFGSSGAADKEVYRADILIQDACAIPVTQTMIDSYTAEWKEKVKAEKEQEAELENLRHTVATQAARVRLLEERAEASDTEHVQLASELVHVKVENEELRDMNDALSSQVGELKVVVDKQPGEVEEKLRSEMERIMKRNLEVQNENRTMEDNMSDMEKELVATKMKWAELCENHENLKQKWSDLRRALD